MNSLAFILNTPIFRYLRDPFWELLASFKRSIKTSFLYHNEKHLKVTHIPTKKLLWPKCMSKTIDFWFQQSHGRLQILISHTHYSNITEVTELNIKYVYVSKWICEYVIPFASKAIYAYLTLYFCVYCFCILYSWVFTHWLHWLLCDFWLLCCFLFVSSVVVGWGPWGLHCVVGSN